MCFELCDSIFCPLSTNYKDKVRFRDTCERGIMSFLIRRIVCCEKMFDSALVKKAFDLIDE